MRFRISLNPRVLLLLLFTEVTLSLASVFLFLRLDGLVNNTLYEFGLQFNGAWAQNYWFYAQSILSLLVVMTVLSCISAAYIQIRSPTGISLKNWALAGIALVGTVAGSSSAFLFTRLDFIVHSDLYNYGLQFSDVWANSYWFYARLMLGFISVLIIMNSAFALYFFSNGFHSDMNSPLGKLTNWTLSRLTTWLLLLGGGISLALSLFFESPILAFIGLGLLFWGIILLYVAPQEYVPENIAASMIVPSLVSLNQIIENLGYQGKAFYLPPAYSEDFESSKVYIGREVGSVPPASENFTVGEKSVFLNNPEAAVVDAPGIGLSRLFEETLGTKFTDADLQYIQEKIGDLIVDDLEIARSFRMSVEKNKINMLVEGIISKDVCKAVRNLSHLYGNVGCPISSALACALAKATANLIIIEKELISEDGRSLEVEYRMMEKRI